MLGAIWNIRGVGKAGAATCLVEVIRDYKLDFIGILETMKQTYSDKFFRKIDPSNSFFWKWAPSVGKSGGILVGVRNEFLDVSGTRIGNNIIQFNLWDKRKKCQWALLVVYGPAHEELKEAFLSDLSEWCNKVNMPYIVGGDFNLIRHAGEKNRQANLPRSSHIFNSVINTANLREIFMSGGMFTWTNNQNPPILVKLDRFLMSSSWEDMFPLVTVKKVVRDISDHNMLVVDSGSDALIMCKRKFRFDTSWFKHENFLPAVKLIWDKKVFSCDPIDVINIKIKRFKKYFKGWGANVFGHMKKEKLKLTLELNDLEQLEEMGNLDEDMIRRKGFIIMRLMEFYSEEESYWHQRSNENWLLYGDNNTNFFHKIANGKRRKKTIHQFEDGEEVIVGTENLLAHATTFYKNLFGPAPGNLFSISPDLWEEHEKINSIDNLDLTRPFSVEEIKHAVFSMKLNKAPGPDDIPIEFFQHCWDVVEHDIMLLFHAFHRGELDVQRLNYGVITLLPKINDANKIQQYRPICLLRCIYKIITKTLTIRLDPYSNKLFSEQQNAFIKKRNICDGIMSLHELIHHTHVKKKVGVVLKLDFEKAYDKVNWDFLIQCHKVRGFSDVWCNWVHDVLHNGTVSVKINDTTGPYFQSAKGVRQGDPFSPTLFNMAGECLTKMVLTAQKNGLFVGLAADLITNGVAILQYADDTVICIEHDLEKAVNLKLLLYMFELMSGLKINFLKSEIFVIEGDNEISSCYANMFNCQVGNLPMKYLGVPISYATLKNSDWDFVDSKCIKKLASWICDNASSGGRLTLLQSSLSGIPMYFLSMFLWNKTFIEKITKHMRRFFWKKKYYMVKWKKVCKPKNKGGLGVKDLHRQNISLLVKWWWKLETQDSLWGKIIKAKYFRNKTVSSIKTRFNDSPCWKAIMKVKEVYMAGRQISLSNGRLVRVWKDMWLDKCVLMEKFPLLFSICQDPDISFSEFANKNFTLDFRRRIPPELQVQWDMIVERARGVVLHEAPDVVRWKLNPNGIFSTKSVYKFLEADTVGPNYKWIWKPKLPLKIKIFLWQMVRDANLTRDNLKKRKWLGNQLCSFCDQPENRNHLFFTCSTARSVWGILGGVFNTNRCPSSLGQCWAWLYAFWPGGKKFYTLVIAAVCWSIWITRNKVTFEGYKLMSPVTVVFTVCGFLKYWAGLYSEEERGAIVAGAEQLKDSATLVAGMVKRRATAGGPAAGILMITDGC